MIILHLALGGCLKAPPVDYGITADTGGHIAYVLEAALHQAQLPEVSEVVIVTRQFSDGRFDTSYARESEPIGSKINIIRIPTTDAGYFEKEQLTSQIPSFTDGLVDYLRQRDQLPDIIHAHFSDASTVAATVQKVFGIPFVYTPHALGINKQAQALSCDGLNWRIDAETAAIANAGAIIVSTRDEADRQIGAYRQVLGRRLHVVPPGVPRMNTPIIEGRAKALLATSLSQPERPIILAVSRPVTKKNLVSLLTAYADDEELQSMANLVILAGQHIHASGEERHNLDDLLNMSTSRGLQGLVAFPPSHDAEDVAALYSLASKGGVFVNPALHEPFGLTLIEAAAAGTPVVATRNGGPAEIIGKIGHGTLVDPRDTYSIASSIKAIISDEKQHAMLSEAALTGASRYCWNRYASASLDIYRAALQPGLLICDIDNTLTGSLESAQTFEGWRQTSDLPFIVATGRSFHAARMILRRWGLPEPDAFITDVGTRLMLRDDEGGWQECLDYRHHLNEGWDRSAIVDALAPLGLKEQPRATDGPHKISFFGTSKDASRVRAQLTRHGLVARVVFSHGRLIDVLPQRGGKAEAITAYARRLGLSLSHCVAAGDSGNDADMLAACGHAIVVSNASSELDALLPRKGLMRVSQPYAAGVLEGLARLGLHVPGSEVVAAAA